MFAIVQFPKIFLRISYPISKCSKLLNHPAGLIINSSGWVEGPKARAPKLARRPAGPHGPIWPLGPAGPRANFRARAGSPPAQPEGLIIKPDGLFCNFEYPFCTVLLAHTFLLFFGRIPKYGFGHEADRQKCYGRKNTGKFGVSANRIQWTMSRTKIRPKSSKKFKLYFAYPKNPWFCNFENPFWVTHCPATQLETFILWVLVGPLNHNPEVVEMLQGLMAKVVSFVLLSVGTWRFSFCSWSSRVS